MNLATVTDSAPNGVKDFWWNLSDISKILNLGAVDTKQLSSRRDFNGTGLDMQSVQLKRGEGVTRFFLIRSFGHPPQWGMRSEEERNKNARERPQVLDDVVRATRMERRQQGSSEVEPSTTPLLRPRPSTPATTTATPPSCCIRLCTIPEVTAVPRAELNSFATPVSESVPLRSSPRCTVTPAQMFLSVLTARFDVASSGKQRDLWQSVLQFAGVGARGLPLVNKLLGATFVPCCGHSEKRVEKYSQWAPGVRAAAMRSIITDVIRRRAELAGAWPYSVRLVGFGPTLENVRYLAWFESERAPVLLPHTQIVGLLPLAPISASSPPSSSSLFSSSSSSSFSSSSFSSS